MLYVEALVVLALVVLNGFFAMSELAIVSSKRSRLEQMATSGSLGARRALLLLGDPTGFLSTVQIGITLIGIVAGAYSGATFAGPLANLLSPLIANPGTNYAVAFTLVVVATTYLSLVVGELVPKRIALGHAERIAGLVSGPMLILSRIGLPLVWVLRRSTNGLLRLIGMHGIAPQSVTEEDIKALLLEGAQSGVLEPQEMNMIDGVMRIADRHVRSIMVPRREVRWLSADDKPADLMRQIREIGHARYPLCGKSLDDVIGIIHVKDVLHAGTAPRLSLRKAARPVLYVNETMPVMRLMDRFRTSTVHMAVVLDEYGSLQGIVTPTDVLIAIAGDFLDPDEIADSEAVRREDGSWLMDGAIAVEDAASRLGGLALEEDYDYVTLAGLILSEMGHLPAVGEHLDYAGWRFEVVDLDGRRIDKVLVSRMVA